MNIKSRVDFDDTSTAFVQVSVVKTSEHRHEASTKMQVRGEQRVQIAETIKAQFNGSSKAYCQTLEARGVTPPLEATIRKLLNEVSHRDSISTCWMTNLSQVSSMARSVIRRKHISGYVQQAMFEGDFVMQLHLESQLRCISKYYFKFCFP